MSKNFHKELLDLIQKNSGKGTQHTDDDVYLGTSRFRYPINTPTLRKLIKEWAHLHQDISSPELVELITFLVKGTSSTETKVAGLLLDYMVPQRSEIAPSMYEEWLQHVEGWSEIDGLCQGHFTPKEMLANWAAWKKTITHLSKSKNISLRRGAMALLITPSLGSGDERFSEISLQVIERTKHESDILITKAISWLMRSMVKHQRKELELYLKKEKESLPKIALRELMVKLETGTKGGKGRSKGVKK